jgi:hypothetical protein
MVLLTIDGKRLLLPNFNLFLERIRRGEESRMLYPHCRKGFAHPPLQNVMEVKSPRFALPIKIGGHYNEVK